MTFQIDPLHSNEPDFRVINGVFLDELARVEETSFPAYVKGFQSEKKRQDFQRNGRLALNRLAQLSRNDPTKFAELIEGLNKLKTDLREMPSQIISYNDKK